MNTPKQKCTDCGHISDQFIQPAKVDCDALVDYKGEFQWWKSENFENPSFEHGTFMCENCYSENLEDYTEEKTPEEYIKEAFDAGALAITLINGKPAPWTPFGMEPDIRNFTRGNKANRKKKEEE
jgi:hypothetical protein